MPVSTGAARFAARQALGERRSDACVELRQVFETTPMHVATTGATATDDTDRRA
jgi:hypothetical protein